MRAKVVPGRSWLAIALSTGQSNAGMRCVFSNIPAPFRYVELLQTQRQKVPALKAAIEDLKAGRLQAGWDKLERHGVIKEVIDGEALRQRAVEQHLKALRSGKTSLMISPRHEEARKVAAIVRLQLKAQGAIQALRITRSLFFAAWTSGE